MGVIIQIRNMEIYLLMIQDQETQTSPSCYGIRTLVKATIGTFLKIAVITHM
jgi:hypothetical protein